MMMITGSVVIVETGANEKDPSKYAYSLGARIEHMTVSELNAIPEV